jgi:hypothetical protein
MAEEEFVDLIVSNKVDKLVGNWRGKLEDAKSRLVSNLDFDGCNAWLDDARFFAEQALVSDRREAACRLFYLVLSFFLIGLDYASRWSSLEDGDARRKELTSGFRYGSKGKKGTEDLLNTAFRIISSYAPELRSRSGAIKNAVSQDLGNLPVEILSEHFSRREVGGELFSTGRVSEDLAYSQSFTPPGQLPGPLQGLLGVILDFHKISRPKFFENWQPSQ